MTGFEQKAVQGLPIGLFIAPLFSSDVDSL
jgi:hypothetical protein